MRDGEALRRIGVVAELFDDHSPLQRGAAGRLQGQPFTLVGRLQYGYDGGTWNEWHALFDNGRSGWLSEDNGAFVFAFDSQLADAPAQGSLRAGQRVGVAGMAWDVASVTQAKLLSAEGELPRPPLLERGFEVVDLRNAAGEVGTLDYGEPSTPGWSIGRSVALSELQLTGLKDGSEKTLSARGVECPNCGAALEVKLSSTQSITCTQCNAVVDVSKGVGADLAHYEQTNGAFERQIPLGRTGTLALGGAPLPWQAVGYVERCTEPEPGEDETWFWREYLLHHPSAGFAFLVDSDEGWSWVRPLTGAPQQRGERAEWAGTTYQRKERYRARVTWVQGEFYWRLQRDERAQVTDYIGTGVASRKRLSREQTAAEVTWSAGETLAAADIAKAFGIAQPQALQRDVAPQGSGWSTTKIVLLVLLLLIVLALVETCSGDDCGDTRATFGESSYEYRQCLAARNRGGGGFSGSGGSYGGWSSSGGGGGSHK